MLLGPTPSAALPFPRCKVDDDDRLTDCDETTIGSRVLTVTIREEIVFGSRYVEYVV